MKHSRCLCAIASVALTLFVTPVAYALFAGFSKPRAAEEMRLRRELEDAQEGA